MNEIIILSAKYLFLINILIYGIYFLKTKRKQKIDLLILTLIAFPLSVLIAKILSHFIYDPRPFMVLHVNPLIPHAPGNGFPSDHTLLTMAIASVIFVFNKKLGIILAIIAILIGIARILVLVHHPLDIIGSILIAIPTTYLSFLLIQLLKKKKDFT